MKWEEVQHDILSLSLSLSYSLSLSLLLSLSLSRAAAKREEATNLTWVLSFEENKLEPKTRILLGKTFTNLNRSIGTIAQIPFHFGYTTASSLLDYIGNISFLKWANPGLFLIYFIFSNTHYKFYKK